MVVDCYLIMTETWSRNYIMINQRAKGSRLIKDSRNDTEFVKNLQQQIYLLELETQYLKGGKKAQALDNAMSSRMSLLDSKRIPTRASKGSIYNSLRDLNEVSDSDAVSIF